MEVAGLRRSPASSGLCRRVVWLRGVWPSMLVAVTWPFPAGSRVMVFMAAELSWPGIGAFYRDVLGPSYFVLLADPQGQLGTAASSL
jgi:hypothetical protein